jgi:hypothetical protein
LGQSERLRKEFCPAIQVKKIEADLSKNSAAFSPLFFERDICQSRFIIQKVIFLSLVMAL